MSGNGAKIHFSDQDTTARVILMQLNQLHADMAGTENFDASFVKEINIQRKNIEVFEKHSTNLCSDLKVALRTELENCQHTLKMLKEDDIFFEFRLKGKKTVTQKEEPMSKKQAKMEKRKANLPGKKKK